LSKKVKKDADKMNVLDLEPGGRVTVMGMSSGLDSVVTITSRPEDGYLEVVASRGTVVFLRQSHP
jgi:hypothetical protein